MGKITRKEHKVYINATPSATASYVLLGGDLEELNFEMNNQVESTLNILGESSIKVNKGNVQASVEPYYAEAGTTLFTFLQSIIDDGKELDEVKTDIVEVKGWETPTGDAYPAIKKECYIEVVSYGGDTTGYQIPFNVHLKGVNTEGTFDVVTRAFTAS